MTDRKEKLAVLADYAEMSLQKARARKFDGERIEIVSIGADMMCRVVLLPPPPPLRIPPVITADGRIHVFTDTTPSRDTP